MLVEKFYCINSMADHLLLRPNDFYDGPLSILWHNNGMFGLIQTERVRNDLQHYQDLKKAKLATEGVYTLVYVWNDTIKVKKLS